MKFKGQTVKGTKRQYSLKQQLGQGGFSVIFTTSEPETICKVQVLSNPQIYRAYKNQKEALSQLQHKNIVQLKDAFEIKDKDGYFGFLMLENCNAGNAWNVLDGYGQADVPEKTVMKIGYYVASALEYMHKKGITHRDIKLQNVLINEKGEYKLCDFGSSSKQIITSITKSNREDIQQYIQKTTTPLYRSPQQLDLYSNFEIGHKVDVFALGVLIFMLCFKKQPFETRLSAINKQYFVPEQTTYSSQLISLIEKCFETNPKDRITATQVKKELKELMERKVAQIQVNIQKELDNTVSEILKINNQMLKKTTAVAQTSLFDKIKLIYNQMTTQTQGWIASFVQDNQFAPQLKYNRSILQKCWQKRYKVQKMYEILYKYTQDYKTKSLVNMKLLILLHNFLRKGPPESVSYDDKFSAHRICTRIYKNWKLYQRATDPDDIKRNSYVCLVIRYYSLILISKWKICFENSDLIQGNFSILPFFQSKKEVALLKLPFISQLISFLEMCTQFHQILATRSYLVEIQRSIILSLVDQEYCCVSLVVFLLCAFKEAVCHVKDQIDIDKLEKNLRFIEKDFEFVFKKLQKLFKDANKLAALFQEETAFGLNLKILDKIKAINIREKKPGNFEFKKHINYERSIQGLKIPLSYQEAVKNPNFLKNLQRKDDENVVQVNQFKIKKTQENVQSKIQISVTQTQTHASNISSQQNEGFKKSKQNKVCTTSPQQVIQQKQTQKTESLLTSSKKTSHIMEMEFTHQNLNKDMNSAIKQSKPTQNSSANKPQPDQFKEFLSMVDQKYNEAHKEAQKPLSNNCIKEQKSQKMNEMFNSFSNMADQVTKKNINSVNSSHSSAWNKQTGNIFEHPFQSVGNNKPHANFEAFQIMTIDEPLVGNQTKKQSPKKTTQQPQTDLLNINDNKKQANMNDVRQQANTVYSSISSLTKDVYNTLNKQQEAKKVELMNFFDDDQQEEEKKQQNVSIQEEKPLSDKEILFEIPNNIDFCNKTSPSGFNLSKQDLNHKQSRQYIQQSQRQLGEVNFADEKHFRTMPAEHSFLDLKGFIVQEVKKNAEQYFIDFASLKFGPKVGFGHSSQVFKGQWRGRQVAIKRIKDNMSPSNAKQFKRQIMTSIKIRHHPNLVTLIGIAEYQNQYYIINEFCNGATLFDFLHQSSHEVLIKVKLSIAKQIAKGMLFLHTNDPPIIHRDLKSLNVLLVNKYNGELEPQIKIADFGLSRDFASTYMTGTLGTYHWMAPEIFNNQPYSLKADVYSYGIVLWEILSRSPPYTNLKNPQSLMKFITLQNGRPDLNLISTDCPQQLKFLMIRCWDKYPQNRPNFKQILQLLHKIQLN